MFAPGKFQAAASMGLLSLLLAALGCSDSNDPGGGDGDLVSQQIGPAGGTVRSADGELTLVFPAGAVTQTQTITIEPLETSELGSEFAAFAVERAYLLGPDGLAFQQPVTASVPSPAPVDQPDGSFTVNMGELLTSVGGQARGLGNMRVEEVDGAVLLRGEMRHFSPIVRTQPGVAAMTVTGVPTTAAVGVPFIVQVTLAELTVQLLDPSYLDESEAPIQARFSAEHQPLSFDGEDRYTGSFEYVCVAVGQGKYQGFVGYTLVTEPDNRRGFQNFRRQVQCTEAPLPRLTVLKSGSGTGTVTSNPAGITCGAGTEACSEGYAPNTAVALTATPDAGSVFGGWSGACPGGTAVTTVIMDADKSCTAQFDLQTSMLEPVGRIQLDHQLGAAALDPSDQNRMVTAGFSGGGELNLWDITDPAAPVLLSGSGQSFCAGATSLAFANPGVFMQPTFVATALIEFNGCLNTIPPGQRRVVEYDYAPGQVRFVPGTMDVLIPAFSHSFVERRSMTGSPIRISLGSTKRCPFGLTISGNTALVVGEEGIPNSPLADCRPGLSFIDLTTNQLIGSLDFGLGPRSVAVSPDGERGYVTDFKEDRVYVLEISTRQLISSFPTGDGPVGLALTPDGQHLLVVTQTDGKLSLRDSITGEEVTSVDIAGQNPGGVLVTSDGQRAVIEFFGDEEEDVGGGFETFNLNF